MLTFSLPSDRSQPYRILALGAHPDDLEIGCGATLMRFLREQAGSTLRWVVFSGSETRAEEARASVEALVGKSGNLELALHGFRDGFFPWDGGEIKERFEALKASFEPDLVFTHRVEDAHQDHRLVAELTWQTFRSATILEYEIPKYEGDLGHPNFFVTLSAEAARRKVEHLSRHFASQQQRSWFTDDTFWAMLRLRGVECASPSGFAEAFTCRKVRL
jgi:LmbE family N-acetylglucosaminyl deacetylase